MICKTCNSFFEEHHNTQRYCSEECTPYKNKYMAWDTWRSMHKRCYDPNTNGYNRYGGRGISVCPSWHNYHNFIKDMGLKPNLSYQIDRIDNEKDYTPDNCRWVSSKENNFKKDRVIKISFKGKTFCKRDWAKYLGISPSTLDSRLKNWGLERALTTPRGPTGPKRK